MYSGGSRLDKIEEQLDDLFVRRRVEEKTAGLMRRRGGVAVMLIWQ